MTSKEEFVKKVGLVIVQKQPDIYESIKNEMVYVRASTPGVLASEFPEKLKYLIFCSLGIMVEIVNSESKGGRESKSNEETKTIPEHKEYKLKVVIPQDPECKCTLVYEKDKFGENYIYKVNDITKDYAIKDINEENEFIEKVRRILGMGTIYEKLKKLYVDKDENFKIDTAPKQIILSGAPGTGKTFNARKLAEDVLEKEFKSDQGLDDEKKKELDEYKKARMEFVQFHSSYDYSDFVEGIKPVEIEFKNNSEGNISKNELSFARVDGIFKNFCRKVAKDKDNAKKPYFFIIDEINRADLSKVFGELMFGLEDGYRGEEHHFPTQYQYLPTYKIENGKAVRIEDEKDDFKNGFYIPENVFVIGTMNDIDKSVESFDFALRRRFLWIEADANLELNSAFDEMFKNKEESIKEEIDKKKGNLIDGIVSMNKFIAGERNEENDGRKYGLSKGYQIGPAYFKNYDGKNLDEIWENKIEPLLYEYVRGQVNATAFVDGCKFKLYLRKKNDGAEN